MDPQNCPYNPGSGLSEVEPQEFDWPKFFRQASLYIHHQVFQKAARPLDVAATCASMSTRVPAVLPHTCHIEV